MDLLASRFTALLSFALHDLRADLCRLLSQSSLLTSFCCLLQMGSTNRDRGKVERYAVNHCPTTFFWGYVQQWLNLPRGFGSDHVDSLGSELFPYLFVPLIAAPESIIFSFRFVESILVYSTMTVSFFSTYSIHLKIL